MLDFIIFQHLFEKKVLSSIDLGCSTWYVLSVLLQINFDGICSCHPGYALCHSVVQVRTIWQNVRNSIHYPLYFQKTPLNMLTASFWQFRVPVSKGFACVFLWLYTLNKTKQNSASHKPVSLFVLLFCCWVPTVFKTKVSDIVGEVFDKLLYTHFILV